MVSADFTVAAAVASADMVEPSTMATGMVAIGTVAASMVEPGTAVADMVEPGTMVADTVSDTPLPCVLSLCMHSRPVMTNDVLSAVSPSPVNTRGVPADHTSNKVPSVALSNVNNKVTLGHLLSTELASGKSGSVVELPAPAVPQMPLLEHPSSVAVAHSPGADTIPDSSHN